MLLSSASKSTINRVGIDNPHVLSNSCSNDFNVSINEKTMKYSKGAAQSIQGCILFKSQLPSTYSGYFSKPRLIEYIIPKNAKMDERYGDVIFFLLDISVG